MGVDCGVLYVHVGRGYACGAAVVGQAFGNIALGFR